MPKYKNWEKGSAQKNDLLDILWLKYTASIFMNINFTTEAVNFEDESKCISSENPKT